MQLGRVGIWGSQFRTDDAGEAAEAARWLDQLGYRALWVPGGAGGDILGTVERLLAATERLVVVTGILNVWMHDAGEVARTHARLTGRFPGRFLLGLGVSHAALIDNTTGRRYERPLAVMRRYLDELDAAAPPVPVAERVLAALGPRMLELARRRAAGAHPYLTDPSHTAIARQRLGSGPLLAPEQMVVLESDPATARGIARLTLGRYLALPNYVDNLRRLGYREEDVAGDGSDRLVDGVVAWGSVDDVALRVDEHVQRGADHVCLQVLTDEPRVFPRHQWEALAVLTGADR